MITTHDQIAQEMRQKTTEELLAIWTRNDRGQWSEAAFNAIFRALTERGITVPQQEVFVPPPPRNKGGKGWLFLICISAMAAKIPASLTFGGVFPAEQGRKTYAAIAASYGSEYAARLAANRAMAMYAAFYLFFVVVFFYSAKLIRVMNERRKNQKVVDEFH
jgi:hypothetical protein